MNNELSISSRRNANFTPGQSSKKRVKNHPKQPLMRERTESHIKTLEQHRGLASQKPAHYH